MSLGSEVADAQPPARSWQCSVSGPLAAIVELTVSPQMRSLKCGPARSPSRQIPEVEQSGGAARLWGPVSFDQAANGPTIGAAVGGQASPQSSSEWWST